MRQNTDSLQAVAECYVQTMALWHQYCDTLSLQYHLIRYEDLVERFDEQVQLLCQYLDIPWQEEMRDFNVRATKQGGITTASYHQVTQRLSRHARYRWKNYSKHLAAIMPRLRPYAERLGYPTD